MSETWVVTRVKLAGGRYAGMTTVGAYPTEALALAAVRADATRERLPVPEMIEVGIEDEVYRADEDEYGTSAAYLVQCLRPTAK